jgi:hypothetical protein
MLNIEIVSKYVVHTSGQGFGYTSEPFLTPEAAQVHAEWLQKSIAMIRARGESYRRALTLTFDASPYCIDQWFVAEPQEVALENSSERHG